MPQILKDKKFIASVLIVLFLSVGSFYLYNYKEEPVQADTSSDCVSTASVTCTQSTSSDGAYKINRYVISGTATGTATWTVPSGVTSVQYLVAGGGGGGGGSSTSYAGGAGGGGGGGVLNGTLSVSGTLSIQVGAGGAGGAAGVNDGSNGSNSIFSTITAYGGGGGAGGTSRAGKSGASGGGASYGSTSGGSATQGYAGAAGGTQASAGVGGGGGGAFSAAPTPGTGCGRGGIGLYSTISDSLVYYGNGGGGGIVGGSFCTGTNGYHYYDTEAFLGSGGSGRNGSIAGSIPAPNTGSGGGGANSSANYAGYDGAAGVVIIKYLIPSTADCVSSSGVACVQTITPDGQYKINKYIITGSSTASTTWTPPTGVTSVQYLVVGGGGGGGAVSAGGGGGGGGVLSGTSSIGSSALTITVGAGGAADVASQGLGCRSTKGPGGDSSIAGTGFTTVTANGGGAGAGCSDAGSGGSGGGGSVSSETVTAPGSGITTPAQGYSGGTALPQNGGSYSAAGGGGGSGGAGSSASIVSTYYSSGNGGIGKLSTITGETLYYGGGGGGECHYRDCDYGSGGSGGGGYGSDYHIMGSKGVEIGIVNGLDGFGGGGGGGSYYYDPGKGGSGTVIIKYLNVGCGTANGQAYSSIPSTNLCNTGTASSVSGSGPWTWTCSGTYGTTSCSAYKVGKNWLTGWDYRKKVTINTGSGVASLNSYQVKLTVSYVSGMQTDFDDLRFTTSDGLTSIDYWVESKTDGSSATVWVEVPTIFIGDTNIYMYYGKSSAASASNGENTFAFFDDFSNLNKWIAVGTDNYSIDNPTSGYDCTFTHSVSGGIYYSANNYGAGWTTYSVTLNPIPITNNFIVGTKFKTLPSCASIGQYRFSLRAKAQSGVANGMDDSATTRPEYFYRENTVRVLYRNSLYTYNNLYTNPAIGESPNKKGYSTLTTSMADDTYYKGEISYYGDNNATTKIYSLAGVLMGTDSARILPEGNYILLGDSHTYQAQDWIYVRKYTSVEPTSTFGAEENAYTSTTCGSSTDFCCYITSGACSGTTILNLFDYLGGHAEMPTQTNYGYKLCCVGTGISNSCSASHHATVLRLSSTTDAHVEEGTQSNSAYSSNIACVSSTTNPIFCSYATTCPTGTVCLGSISGITNAHLGECSVYSTKVCCNQVTISSCTAKAVASPSLTNSGTTQICADADTSNTSDACYSACWTGATGTTPVLTDSRWKCSVCRDTNNNAVSCYGAGTPFAITLSGGHSSTSDYTVTSGSLSSNHAGINFTAADTTRKGAIDVNSGMCTGDVTNPMPSWKEVSPF